MESQMIVATSLSFALAGASFAHNYPANPPAPPTSTDPPAAAMSEHTDAVMGEDVAAPMREGMAAPAPQLEASGPHSTTIYHGPHHYPRKQRGRAGNPPMIDHSYDTAPLANPTISSITILPPPR